MTSLMHAQGYYSLYPQQSEANKDQELELEPGKEEGKGAGTLVFGLESAVIESSSKAKKALSGSPTSRSSVGGVIAFGTSRGFSRREDTDP